MLRTFSIPVNTEYRPFLRTMALVNLFLLHFHWLDNSSLLSDGREPWAIKPKIFYRKRSCHFSPQLQTKGDYFQCFCYWNCDREQNRWSKCSLHNRLQLMTTAWTSGYLALSQTCPNLCIIHSFSLSHNFYQVSMRGRSRPDGCCTPRACSFQLFTTFGKATDTGWPRVQQLMPTQTPWYFPGVVWGITSPVLPLFDVQTVWCATLCSLVVLTDDQWAQWNSCFSSICALTFSLFFVEINSREISWRQVLPFTNK